MGEGFWARVFLVGTVYLDFACKVRKKWGTVNLKPVYNLCVWVCASQGVQRPYNRMQSHTSRGCIWWLLTAGVFLECLPNLQIQLYIPTWSSVVETVEQLDWLALCLVQAIYLLHFSIPRMEEFKQRWFVTFLVLQHWVSICLTPVKELILVLPQWI